MIQEVDQGFEINIAPSELAGKFEYTDDVVASNTNVSMNACISITC